MNQIQLLNYTNDIKSNAQIFRRRLNKKFTVKEIIYHTYLLCYSRYDLSKYYKRTNDKTTINNMVYQLILANINLTIILEEMAKVYVDLSTNKYNGQAEYIRY